MIFSRKEFMKMAGLGALATAFNFKAVPAAVLDKAAEISRGLKITDVEIFLFDIPLREPFRISIGEMKSASDVLVRIRTDQGITGLGEACPFAPITGETQATSAAACQALREIVRGKDPLMSNAISREFGALVHSNPSAAAAFDMALFDILGKVAGLPLYRLLGGAKSQFETDITVGIDKPERMAERARQFVGQGYRTIKMKVGLNPDEDVERIRAVREAVGDSVNIRADANQGWTVPQAIYALKRIEKYNLQFLEQPVAARDIAGLKHVRAVSPIPIMADESCFLPSDGLTLIREEACDYINIKLMKSGGLNNSLRLAHIADAASMRCMVGCMLESKLALTAAAHFVASQPNIIFADLDGNSEHVFDPVIGGMKLDKGIISLPETAGLGCDIDPSFLKKLRKI